jgi:hypothetical protein
VYGIESRWVAQAKAADIPRQCWFCANRAMNGWQGGKLALQPAHSPMGQFGRLHNKQF